jgi:hypothetical protein
VWAEEASLGLDRGGYPFLVIVAALIGAAVAVVLSVLGVGGAALDGAVGFAVVLWLVAWTNIRLGKQGDRAAR